jgi:hypothetical protein
MEGVMQRHKRTFVCLCVALLGVVNSLDAQTTVNPDISVISRFLVHTDDGPKLDAGVREFSRPDFSFQELELAMQAYLNPFAKADVVMTLPGPDLEAGKLGVEELYATVLRGLPLDMNLRVGKYRAEFGKINMIHPHAWPFITAPLVQERFFGEALNDLGISASVLLPTGDVYTKLTLDLLRGTAIGDATGLVDTAGGSPYYANSGRLSSFLALGDNSDVEVGLSGYTGIHDPYHRDRFWYGNLDLKYKYRPSAYTSLVVQGEFLLNSRTTHLEDEQKVTTSGTYIYADYQFLKVYSIGARIDRAESPYSAEDRASGFAIFAGYYPVEETLGLRLQYARTTTEVPGSSQTVNSIDLQMLFSLGPHKAHPF